MSSLVYASFLIPYFNLEFIFTGNSPPGFVFQHILKVFYGRGTSITIRPQLLWLGELGELTVGQKTIGEKTWCPPKIPHIYYMILLLLKKVLTDYTQY